MTDYRTMSGAEFKREVGADPEKWAEAFQQRAAAISEAISDGLRDELATWFRDAQEASVKAAGTSWPPQDDDQPDDSGLGMKA